MNKIKLFVHVCMLLACHFLSAAIEIRSDGLTLSVAPFEVDGVTFSGGEIEATPDKKLHLVLNLHTNELHLLLRSIGDESLLLAVVKTGKDGVDSIEPVELEISVTYIPNAIEALRDGKPLRVHLFGTSLVETALSSHGWQKILFAPEYCQDPRSMLHSSHPDAVTCANYAVGGTNSRYTIALMGDAVLEGQRLKTEAYDCDLAIVALIPNGGKDRLPIYEGVVRQLRARGLEVLLLTDNSMVKQGNRSGLWGDGHFVHKLADAYGCSIADTASYMLEAETNGLKVYADSIHSSTLGHEAWAAAASGALSFVPGQASELRVVTGEEVPLKEAAWVPQAELVDLSPMIQTDAKRKADGANRLAKAFGVDSPTSIELVTGDQFTLNQDGFIAADVIFAANNTFELEVCEKRTGEILRTVEYKGPKSVGSRPQARPVIAASDFSKVIGKDRYTVKVLSGQLKLYGVSYQY
jgi:hypothetical protein